MNLQDYIEELTVSDKACHIDEIHDIEIYNEHGQSFAKCSCGKSWSIIFANVDGKDCIDFEALHSGDDLLCYDDTN